MTEPDDMLDDDAAANRTDARRAAVITGIALATVVVASMFAVIGGYPADSRGSAFTSLVP